MECKLQTINVVEWCVTLCLFISLIHFVLQVTSLSYHAASDNIVVGLYGGQVDLWLFDLRGPLPAHECIRESLAEAQAQVDGLDAALKKADNGLRQQMARDQELKKSIADLEAKCAFIYGHRITC